MPPEVRPSKAAIWAAEQTARGKADVAAARIERQQRDAQIASVMQARGLRPDPDFLFDVDTILSETRATPAQAVDRVIAHWGNMEQELPRATPQSAPMPDIRGAAQAIARESGSGTVDLADLQRRTGLPLPQLHALVRQEIEAGRATPTRDTSRGRGSKARDAAGMDIGGERYVSVVFR